MPESKGPSNSLHFMSQLGYVARGGENHSVLRDVEYHSANILVSGHNSAPTGDYG